MQYLLFALPLILPTYLIRFQIGPFPTNLLEVLIWGFLLFWLATRRTNGIKNAWQAIKPWRWAILAWFASTALAVIISPDKIGALGHWRAYILEPVLVFFALGDISRTSEATKNWRTWLVSGIAAITIALSAFAVFQFLTGLTIPHPWNVLEGRRATGFFDFPNALSLFLVPFGTLCFALAIDSLTSRKQKESIRLEIIILGIAAVCGIIGVLLAKSMGGVLALGVGMLSVLIMNLKTRKIGIVLAIIGALGASLVAFTIIDTELHPQNINDSLTNSKKWSSMVRIIIWNESIKLALDNPVLGTGLRSFPVAIIPYHKATWMEVFQQPHNLQLMLWIETGLPGLLAFAWLCVIWIQLARKRPSSWIWIAHLLALLVHGMVDVPYFKNDLAMQFWILAALASFPAVISSEVKQVEKSHHK